MADVEVERNIAGAVTDYLKLHGYIVARDAALKGRSGAKYDIDVLAEKSDPVTTFKVMFQCKGWDAPIDKDVLAGVHLAMTDLGINKAIVVSSKGWKAAAEPQARRLGIELWGPVEIEGRLGAIPQGGDQAMPSASRQAAFALPVTLQQDAATQMARRASRGALRVGREEVAWVRAVWLPFHRMRVRHSSDERQRMRKASLRTQEFWNVYEGLSGSLYVQWDTDPDLRPPSGGKLVPPRMPALSIVNEIEATARRYNEATNPEAVERHEEALLAFGIHLPVAFFDMSPEGEVYIPFYLALLRGKDGERVVAIDAHEGYVAEDMSRIAMMHLNYILDATR